MQSFLSCLLRVMTALVGHRKQAFDDGTVGGVLTRFRVVHKAGVYLLYDTDHREGKVPYQIDFVSSANMAQHYLDTCIKDPLVIVAMLGLVTQASLEDEGRTFTLSTKDARGPFTITIRNGVILTEQPVKEEVHKNNLRLAVLASTITVAERLSIDHPDDDLVRALWHHGFTVPGAIGESRVIVKWIDDNVSIPLAEVHAHGHVSYQPSVERILHQFLLVCGAAWAMSTLEREPTFMLPHPRRFAPHLKEVSVRGGEFTLVHAERIRVSEPTN